MANFEAFRWSRPQTLNLRGVSREGKKANTKDFSKSNGHKIFPDQFW